MTSDATVAGRRFPVLRQFVLDSTTPRVLAEFYRELLGYTYSPGDQPGGEYGDEFIALLDAHGKRRTAIQKVPALPPSTWPSTDVPQQAHLDFAVGSVEELDEQHGRALALGASVLLDRSDDPEEPLRVYADPSGHPFCIFVVADQLA